MPATFDQAEAGKRYRGKGFSSSHRSYRSNRSRIGSIFVRDNRPFYGRNNYRGYYAGQEPRSYRGGPKIINVQEELRRQKRKRMN